MLHLSQLEPELKNLARRLNSKRISQTNLLNDLKTCIEKTPDIFDRWKIFDKKALSALPLENPSSSIAPKPRPNPFTLCSTDGSQIFPDRNINLSFALINISQICFQIGTVEPPVISQQPYLFDLDDLSMFPFLSGLNVDDEQFSDLVGPLRQFKELEQLYTLAKTNRVANRPVLALSDGTLIFWHLKKIQNPQIQERLFTAYTEILKKFRLETLPIFSYISFPSGREIVKSLNKLVKDRFETINLQNWLYDRDIFSLLLKPKERSSVFVSHSDVMENYDEADKIFFFYLHTGKEIARVELPGWCFYNASHTIDYIHSCILDDVEKGGGYPMCLSEAHENAVISQHDQANFYKFLEILCQQQGLNFQYSAKLLSKRFPKL